MDRNTRESRDLLSSHTSALPISGRVQGGKGIGLVRMGVTEAGRIWADTECERVADVRNAIIDEITGRTDWWAYRIRLPGWAEVAAEELRRRRVAAAFNQASGRAFNQASSFARQSHTRDTPSMQLGLATEYRTEQMFQRVLAKHFKEMHFNLYRLPKFDKLEWLSMLVKHNLYRAYLGGEDVVRCLPIAVEPGRPLYSRYGMRMSTGGRRQVPHERPGGWVLYWVPREADGKEILRWGFFTWHKERSIWLCDGGAAC